MSEDRLAVEMMEASVVVCIGIGKSGKVAALAADLLQSVGVRAVYMHAVDVAHGGANIFPTRGTSMLIGFTHSGTTTELVYAMYYVKMLGRNVHGVAVTSAEKVLGAHTVLQYMSKEFNRHGTVPVQASIAQIATIGKYVNQIADVCTAEYLHSGHPNGAIGDIYEKVETQ